MHPLPVSPQFLVTQIESEQGIFYFRIPTIWERGSNEQQVDPTILPKRKSRKKPTNLTHIGDFKHTTTKRVNLQNPKECYEENP